jgi:hypothetical protein
MTTPIVVFVVVVDQGDQQEKQRHDGDDTAIGAKTKRVRIIYHSYLL